MQKTETYQDAIDVLKEVRDLTSPFTVVAQQELVCLFINLLENRRAEVEKESKKISETT